MKIRDRLKILLFLIEPDCPIDYEVVKKDFCMKRQEANKECNSFDCWEDLTSTLYLDETGVHAYEEAPGPLIDGDCQYCGEPESPACICDCCFDALRNEVPLTMYKDKDNK